PPAWPEDPLRGTVPHVLPVEQHRCLGTSSEAVHDGVFYVETFFATHGDRELIVAVQGAVKVWVDDVPVLERDFRDWGTWHRFGAAVKVGDGRHRVLGRVIGAASSVRLLNLDGTSAGLESDVDAQKPYSAAPAQILFDPNPIDAIIRARAASSPLQAM